MPAQLATVPAHLTFPRVTDLAAITPFAQRWEVARRQRTTAATVTAELARVGEARPMLQPVAALAAQIERSWLRHQTLTLFKTACHDFPGTADLRAFHAAAKDRAEVLRWLGEYDTAHDGWNSTTDFEREAARLMGAIGSTDATAADVQRLATRAAKVLVWEYDEDSENEPVLSGYEVKVLKPVWLAMEGIFDGIKPDHPENRPRSLAACLDSIRAWYMVIDRQTQPRSLSGAAGEPKAIGVGVSESELPAWVAPPKFKGWQLKLVTALWSGKPLSRPALVTAVWGKRRKDPSDATIKGIIQRVNDKFTNYATEVGLMCRVAQSDKEFILDKSKIDK